MKGFTPPQQQQLQTWAAERDAILRDKSIHAADLERIKNEKAESQLALDDTNKQLAETRGRLAELTALEERHRTSVSVEVAELEARKTRLETECASLVQLSADHAVRISEKIGEIEMLTKAHDKMADQAQIVDQVVGQVIAVSQNHIVRTKEAMSEIAAIHTSVIDKANENLAQTNIVLEKMPRFIFDMQRPIPVRRTYPAGHPHADQGIVAGETPT